MEDKILRFAVAGVGGIGRSHISGIEQNKHALLTAVCDIDAELENEYTGSVKFYTDYNQMLKDEEIDVAVICVPDQIHKEYTVTALRAGIHVLCEKPMALQTDDCREMIQASRETGKKLMIGQVCRKAPGFMLAKQLVDAGEIGELFFVESEYAHDYAKIPGRGGWRIDPVNLRHPVIGGGCHAIDLLRWIAGNPSEVFAYANRKMLKSWPVDDCTVAIMKFPDGVIGKVMTSIGCKRTYTMRTVLYGSRGTIICDNTSPEITLQREYNNKDGQRIVTKQLPVDINNHNIASEIEEMCDAVIGNTDVPTDGIEGASTVAVGCAIVESAVAGEKVLVDYNF
jgi:UDP-N-acetylglucosamine 3-dehydrogenase